MKPLYYSLIVLSMFFVSAEASAMGQCKQKRDKADKECDEKQVEQIMKELDAGVEHVKNRMKADVKGTGGGDPARTIKQEGKPLVEKTGAKNEALLQKCRAAIQDCESTCQREAQQKRMPPYPDEPGAQKDDQDKKYCTEDKPKEVEKQAEKNKGNIADALKGLMDMLKALMGQPKDNQQQAQTEPEVEVASDEKSDVASTFKAGEYRSGEVGDLSEGDLSNASGVTPGAPAELEYAQPRTAAGALAPASAGGPGAGGSNSKDDSGAGNGEGGIDIPKGGSYAGGGKGGGGGGSYGYGRRGSGGNNAKVSSVSLEDQQQIQTAVANRLNSRTPSAHGPKGGITGPLSMDNFKKVEKRVDYERHSLNEL